MRALSSGRVEAEIAAARQQDDASVRAEITSILEKLEVSSKLAAMAVLHQATWEGTA